MDGQAGGPLYMLRIEIDGHFHGSQDVPKPWVARIDGTSPKYGLARTFIDRMNDWRDARQAWSGNTYGVVATFALRPGHLYETSRCRGSSSKRRVVRQFYWLDGKKMREVEPLEALAIASGEQDQSASILSLPDATEGGPTVARIVSLGVPRRLGFVVVDSERKYRLVDGLYLVQEPEKADRYVVAKDGDLDDVTQKEALEWLASKL